jgi:protein TonB
MTFDLSPRMHGPFDWHEAQPARRRGPSTAAIAIVASLLVHGALGVYLWKAKFEAAYREYSDPVTTVSIITPAPPPAPPPKVEKLPPKPAPPHHVRSRVQARPPVARPEAPPVQPLLVPPVLQHIEIPEPPLVIAQPRLVRLPPVKPRSPVITRPDWLRRPTGRDMARYYPDRAQRRGVEGRAVMACSVTLAGTLAGCRITAETPADGGFGAAALKMSRSFKLRPMTRDGKPVAGGTVHVPIQFALPQR